MEIEEQILHRGDRYICMTVIIAIHDEELAEGISSVVKGIGLKTIDGYYGDTLAMANIVAPAACARILDTHSFRLIADDLRGYLSETDDVTPLLFWGRDWIPPYYHRSFVDITDVSMGQLELILRQICCYDNSAEHNSTPLVFSPVNFRVVEELDRDWLEPSDMPVGEREDKS